MDGLGFCLGENLHSVGLGVLAFVLWGLERLSRLSLLIIVSLWILRAFSSKT